MAPIVITALLLNPLTASSGVIIPINNKNEVAPKATTSIGKISLAKNITEVRITKIKITDSKGIKMTHSIFYNSELIKPDKNLG